MNRNSSCLVYWYSVIFIVLHVSMGCSMVFTSSINGRIIDKELREQGTVQGIADARVFLYTEKKAWEKDFSNYREGDLTTLPDAPGRSEYNYFQSTVTNAQGNFQISGIIWHTYFSQFGKTADRIEIFLLVYHPDYGLVKNENPYFIVSDVTTELPVMEIEDIWNKGRIFGKVLNWKDNTPLANTSIAVYVPDCWSYSGGSVSDSSLIFPNSPTYTTTTDTDGTWSITIRFKKMPGMSDTVNKTKVLITWPHLDWRAEDPTEGNPLGTSINNGLVYGDRDINKNGRNAMQGDNSDWYMLSPEIPANEQPIDAGTVTLQRWRFRSTVSGRVVNNSTGQGISGVEITLTIPTGGTKSYIVTAAPQSTQTGIEDGFFNFGELVWELSDITNPEDKKTGKVPVTWSISPYTCDSGAPSNLMPDQNPFIVLRVH